MTHRPGPDFARALADHTVVTGPISGIWSCSSDTCTAQSRDRIDGVLTSKDERQEQWRAHLVEVIEAEISADEEREREASEPCDEEKHSWDHFRGQEGAVDSYWMRCHRLGPHSEHENSETGATWTTA